MAPGHGQGLLHGAARRGRWPRRNMGHPVVAMLAATA
jgi:hypothetical protein